MTIQVTESEGKTIRKCPDLLIGWRRRAEHADGKLSSIMTDLRSENITSLDNIEDVSLNVLIEETVDEFVHTKMSWNNKLKLSYRELC
jgi:hypothetical protein